MRIKLQFAIGVCALAVFVSGCSAPWRMPFSRAANRKAQRASATMGAQAADSTRAGSVPQVPAAASNLTVGGQDAATTASPELASVLEELQQVRTIDPAAELQLLEQLRRTPPDSWPLMAEQFRASLAYHHQLTSSERPSAPIGELVDPRSTRADGISSEAFAQATPYSISAPGVAVDAVQTPSITAAPADFASDAPIYPMAARDRTSQAEAAAAPTNATKPWPATRVVAPTVAQASLQAVDRNAAVDISPGVPHAVDEAGWQELVERATDDLSRRVAKSPATTAEVHQHVSLRILRLLTGDTEKAMEPIPHISPTEHDFWSKQVFALATYLDHHSQPDDKRRAAASVTHLDEAVSHLRELGSLSVRNLAFCKNVYGYGAIEPYDADVFAPGERVSLYVEVENYHSKSTEKGYCTSLGSTYEILDEQGKRVGGGEIPDVNDCCRSRRRDFHIQYGLVLPEKLSPGMYRLQIVIKDRQSDKMGNASAAFEIKGTAP